MSSFDTAREQWELYHMKKIDDVKEAAANGDPAAMEAMAYSIYMIYYNRHDEVIELLTAASDAGRQTASWKLADLYANRDKEKYHGEIEHYCKLAFAKGRIYSEEHPEWMHGSIKHWIEEHHPEWCEMEEGFDDDDSYYLSSTGRYGENVFRGIGEKAARTMRSEKEKAEALWEEADRLFKKDNEAGYKAWLELSDADKSFETFVRGAKANDATCFAALSEMTSNGYFYGGNSYVAAYLASRAFELDETEGGRLAICYLDGVFLPVVYPYHTLNTVLKNSGSARPSLRRPG